jgi:integrase
VPKVERTASGSFRIRYTDPWGQRQVITRPTAADVRAAHRRIMGDMARGDYVDPRRGRTTVAQWAEDWLTGARNVGPGGREMYDQALAHILPVLGRLPVAKVSAADIDRYLDAKLGTLASSTVHRHYRTLHRMFAVAVERGVIARNPCEHVHPPRVPRSKFTVLGPDQVDQLADAIAARYRGWVYLAAYGGLRWSEAVGLRRSRVDVPSGEGASRSPTSPERPLIPGADRRLDPGPQGPLGTVRVVEQLVRRRDRTWDRCEPKWGSVRTVTLPDFAADELAAHIDTYALPGPDGLVFPTRNGTPIQGPSWTSNTFKRALARAGLPDIRVHDMRHTSAALAIAAGAKPKALQERMGHRSIKTTLDDYGHLYESADTEVAAGLERLRTARRLRAV